MKSRLAVLLVALACAWIANGDAPPRRQEPIDPSAMKQPAARDARPDSATVDLIVRFRDPARGISTNAIARRREALDARVGELRRDLDRLHVRRTFHRVLLGASVRVPRELRARLGAMPYVASVHEDRPVQAQLANSVPRIRAPQAWAQHSTRGAGVTVAVIDTGIDYTHPAFGGGFGDGFKVAGGWDFVDGDADPMDESGHGTHVAGVIAADGGGLLGVAPNVKLIAYRVIGPGGGTLSDIIAAIERCVDPDDDGDPSDRVDVVNMSVGGFAQVDDPAAAAVDAATAAGVLFVIAAGNWGDYGNILTPGTASSAITVGAADHVDGIAQFSSRGPRFDYTVKPEVTGPGTGIMSAAPGGRVVPADGTSMATPHVAGVAALVKAVHPDWTPAQIKTAIVTTTQPHDGDVMAAGSGRIDALKATSIATLASPSLVNFGQIDALKEVWTTKQTVTLRNMATTAQTLTAAVRGQRDGVTLSVTPAAVTIAPGESADVTIELAVTNAAVPAPREGSLSFGGRIEWTGAAVPIHVPWSFVKGAFLTIEVPGAINESLAYILGSRRTSQTDFFWDSARMLWPLEKVDVIVNEIGSPSRRTRDRIVVAEEVDTFATPRVSVRMEDAQFTLAASTTDETGGPMGANGRSCTEQFVFSFPSNRKYTWGQTPETRARFGPFSERVKIYVLNTCADVEHETVYAAIHEPLRGIRESVTSTLQPQWLRQDVRFAGSTEEQLTSALQSLRFPGPEETFYFSGGWFYLMRGTKPALTLYYAKSPVPEVELMGWFERWSRCYDPSRGHDVDCEYLDHVHAYFDDRGMRVEGDIYFEVSPMAYRVPAGTTATFGDGPVWPQVGFFAGPGLWGTNTSWYGPLGELRQYDSQHARSIVRDAAGVVLGDTEGFLYKYETLEAGIYSVQSIDTHYAVLGIPGTATATATLDMRKPEPYYPHLTGLRVEDANGEQLSILERNEPATLYLSVADLYREGLYLRRGPPREEATRVEYRRRGTREWRSLTPVVHARHYHNNNYLNAGVGTMYRVDLSTMTREITGGVDLRIYAEDAGGNSIELVLEPAVFVGDRPKTRAVRR